MLNIKSLKRVHMVGVGGINMSAVAKLLLHDGLLITGSDAKESDITKQLASLGIKVFIGPHDERNLPDDCQAVIHTSAAPETNPERVAAKNRHLPDLSNFEWLGEWFKDKKVVLVTGTHGKSTTTGLLASMCIEGGLDPTVIIGSKMPDWPEGNIRIGQSDLVIIEGDEYAKHFLSFHPAALIINNIELDHVDVFHDIDEMRHAFERLLRQTKSGASVVYNADSSQAVLAVESVKLHSMNAVYFSELKKPDQIKHALEAVYEYKRAERESVVYIKFKDFDLILHTALFGLYNAQNVVAAALMAHELGVDGQAIFKAVDGFRGIWRRMELVGEKNSVPVYSDYGHHPTAVNMSMRGLREAFPDKRIVLCFQPHHKNRTKQLFDDFVKCFDQVDALVLCEIYDVVGRDAASDQGVSSKQLLESIEQRSDRGYLKHLEYAPNPEKAIKQTFALLEPGDVCVIMGAGDIDDALRSELRIKN